MAKNYIELSIEHYDLLLSFYNRNDYYEKIVFYQL